MYIHTQHLLLIVKLYCVIGSAIVPDTAGPATNPTPRAVVSIPNAKGCVLSVHTSDTAALAIPTIPMENIQKDNLD